MTESILDLIDVVTLLEAALALARELDGVKATSDTKVRRTARRPLNRAAGCRS